jgi:phosphate transport system permease protein
MAAGADARASSRERSLREVDARYLYRRGVDKAVTVVMAVSTAFCLFVLAAIVGYVIYRGASYINWEFLTHMPVPLGRDGGGIANAIVGSLIIVAMAIFMAVPVGIGSAVYLSEFPGSWLGRPVRLVADVLTGVPSIVVGLFAYAILVAPFGTFSGYAGAGALAFIMVPIILISAQESLRLVPDSLREGALALGVPRWRVIISVVVPAAYRALITGLVLAIARALGETAPLLFTAFGNRFWSTDPGGPMAAVPLVIYRYAIGPYPQWHEQAWAAAFILVVIVIISSILTRLVLRTRYER